MYNKDRTFFIKDTKPFGEPKEDEIPVGVTIVAYTETKNVDDILDFGFGEYRDFARYLMTTRELPLDGKFDLRFTKHSDLVLSFPGCASPIPCMIEKITMVEQKTVDGIFKLELKIKLPYVGEHDMGVICSQVKHKVIAKLTLMQSELPLADKQKEEAPKPKPEKEDEPEAKPEQEQRQEPVQEKGPVQHPPSINVETDPSAFPFDDGSIEQPGGGSRPDADPLEEYDKKGPDYGDK